jgi:pimeloyl-ACP methyl ester carboxylesterase
MNVWRIFGKILRVALIVWVGLLVILALSQRSMTYFPTVSDAVTLAREAAQAGLEPWTNASGETIGYHHLASTNDPRPPVAFLILHGNAGYAVHRSDLDRILRQALPNNAVSTYILEYPGYGARQGSPTQEAMLNAASEAVSIIPSRNPLFLVGESLGTGVAAATASSHPERISGLLLLTPFDSLANVAQHHYPLLPIRWIMLDQYPSAQWLKEFPGRAVFLLAENDSIVPPELGRSLYDSFSGPKLLVVAEQSDHNDLVHSLPTTLWRQALEFLLQP